MNRLWDNPVARHAGRLAVRRGWFWGVLALLLLSGALGIALQKFWMELEIYSAFRPRLVTRWLATALLAETLLVLPWAAVRGTLLWRKLSGAGVLEEYRRSRLSPGRITLGLLWAVLFPAVVLVVVSLAVMLPLALLSGEPTLPQVAAAYLLLLAQTAAFGALGLWLASRVRHPGLAIPIALSLLALAVGGIWLLDPWYRALGDPGRWIYGALLPNPVTAVGSALGSDVLRFSWIYERIHAHEYFFVYPPFWQTAGAYLLLGAVLTGAVIRRLAGVRE